MHSRAAPRRRIRLGLLALAASALAGCAALDLLETERASEAAARYAHVAGHVATASPSDHPLVVLVLRLDCAQWREVRAALVARGPLPPGGTGPSRRTGDGWELVAHVVRERPGLWYQRLAPGCYAVAAFEDVNEDDRYEDEPALRAADPARMLELGAGERREGIELVIPPDGRLSVDRADPVELLVRDLQVRSGDEQLAVSLDSVAVEGRVADLADPRFGPENGKLGYFDFTRFAWEAGPGVYFLEDYDPGRIPVLFVHGALGYPQQFAALIAGLDRSRYQPWLFFYPSGARLGAVSAFLSQLVTRLRLRLGFPEMVVVAHSMGGLVARAFILEHHAEARVDPVRLFVAISTPWAGLDSAEQGVERSPVVVPSWRDVATGSEFLRGIFFEDPGRQTRPRRLGVPFHLVFGVRDRTIGLSSAARWEAVREATSRWPLDYGHVDILKSPEASRLLGEILAGDLPARE
jgi:pimeloyl-ACP methyl ester carboxylesterase